MSFVFVNRKLHTVQHTNPVSMHWPNGEFLAVESFMVWVEHLMAHTWNSRPTREKQNAQNKRIAQCPLNPKKFAQPKRFFFFCETPT